MLYLAYCIMNRQDRIAAAVERSKVEYQSHHAYTERGELGQSKHELEYTVTRQNDENALDILWTAFPDLSRELLDTAIRIAVRLGDERALPLAEASKVHVGCVCITR